jgi:hypothetical protein
MGLINNRGLVLEYDLQLEKMQEALTAHDRAAVNLLKAWRDELRCVSDQGALKVHAARTARSMGGMGSLGEVVLMGNDPNELRLMEELYAICRFILSS